MGKTSRPVFLRPFILCTQRARKMKGLRKTGRSNGENSLSPTQRINDCSLADTTVDQLNQRLQYLIQVIQQLAVARDLNAIMAVVRTGARQLTRADGATFVLRDGDYCYYADEDAVSPLWKGGRFPMSACISGWVMLNQQSVVIEDIYADPRIPVDAYRPTFVKSLAMVPIRTRDPLGAIGNYWATHHTPTSEELSLLQTLADAAAVALENVYLYDEQERRIQERTAQLQRSLDFESLLKRITDNIRDTLDERKVLATVVEEMARTLALSRCSTSLYDLDQASTTVCYEYKQATLTVACGTPQAMADFPELYAQLLSGETVQFCRLSRTHSRSIVDVDPLVLVCPIVDDHQVLGDMRLYRVAAEPFETLEVRLVQQVASQCAIALRQARLHEAMQAQVSELERLNQLKNDFLSTISHELRSPMASIRMAVQMLQATLATADGDSPSAPSSECILSQAHVSKVIAYLKILSQECQRETNLINNLLDFTCLETETLPNTVQQVALQEWIPQLAEQFQEQIQQHQQELQVNIPKHLPLLKINLPVLERILTELLQNACKFTPAREKIMISASINETQQTVTYFTSSPYVLVTVSNSGTSIAKRDRAHIFDKFYRIPSNDPWKHGGTGLGLALVQRLVKQLEGSIDVSSEDHLVSFTVKFPSVQPSSIDHK